MPCVVVCEEGGVDEGAVCVDFVQFAAFWSLAFLRSGCVGFGVTYRLTILSLLLSLLTLPFDLSAATRISAPNAVSA